MYYYKKVYKTGERGALTSFFANVGLFMIKFFAGIIGNSSAMIADAVHTLSDLFSDILVFIGFKIAQKPPDKDHPYGHGRAESIAAKMSSLILIFLGVKVLLNSFHATQSAHILKPGIIAIVAAAVSIVVKLFMYFYVIKLGRKIESASLKTNAYHHQSDAFSSIAALIGIWFARMGFPLMDPVAGMIVAAYVIKTGMSNFHIAYDELMDSAPSEDIVKKIENIVLLNKSVKTLKEMNVRKMGLEYHIDLTIEVDKNISVEDGHAITVQVQRDIKKYFQAAKSVLIHVEPFRGGQRG